MSEVDKLPRWFNTLLSVGTVVVALAVGWGMLDTTVRANSHATKENEVKIESQEKRIDILEQNSVKALTILERLEQKMDDQSHAIKDLDKDLNEHMRANGRPRPPQ